MGHTGSTIEDIGFTNPDALEVQGFEEEVEAPQEVDPTPEPLVTPVAIEDATDIIKEDEISLKEIETSLEKARQEALLIQQTANKIAAQPGTVDLQPLILTRGEGSTEEERSIFNPDINRDQIQRLINQGFTVVEGSLPSSITLPVGGESSATLNAITVGNQALIDSQKSVDDAIAALDASQIRFEAETQSLIEGIKGQYAVRKRQMEDINRRRVKQLQAIGFRSGSIQFAEEVFGGVISSEERQGIDRLSELDSLERQEVAAARRALEDKNFDVLNEKLKEARSLRDQQLVTISELNKASIEQSKKIRAKQERFERDTSILSIYATETKNPLEIFSRVNFDINGNVIGNISIKEIEEALKSVDIGGINLSGEVKDFQSFIDIGLIDITGTKQQQWEQYLKIQGQSKGLEILSPSEAQKLGVAFGTTKREAYGIVPIKDTTSLNLRIATQVDRIVTSFDGAPIVKQYNEVQNKLLTFSSIINLGVGGPGDLALVFEFMKALDPGSVVRESEYAAAASSGNIFAGIFTRFNKGYFAPEGGILPDRVKQDFLKIVQVKYEAINSQYTNLRSEKGRLIDRKTGDADGMDFLVNYETSSISNLTAKETDSYLVETSQGTIDLTKFEE